MAQQAPMFTNYSNSYASVNPGFGGLSDGLNVMGIYRDQWTGFKDNTYDVDAAFIAVGSQDTLSLAKHLGLIVDESGDLIVTNSHTNISGIFAGGDCVQGVKQIVKAASDGCVAAYEIKEYLRGKES